MDRWSPLFNIALIEPEIPENTGNIARTCVGMDCYLHLVGKLGFELSDRYLRRAGLDYWRHLHWEHHAERENWQKMIKDPKRVFYFSTKANQTLFDVRLQRGDWLVFGKETKGLPEDLIFSNLQQAIKLPMTGPIRSLNLSNSVAISIYEGYRQLLA